jgi:hypothetical protein
MTLRNRLKDPNQLRRAGLLILLAAHACGRFSHPSANFPAGLLDGTTGLLYGLSFGCLLLSLKRNGSRRCA